MSCDLCNFLVWAVYFFPLQNKISISMEFQMWSNKRQQNETKHCLS